jgi:hypothetical protein
MDKNSGVKACPFAAEQEEKSVFSEAIISVILGKMCTCICVLLRTVSEIELLHCTLYRRATRHVLTRVAKCTDVNGGIFENVLYCDGIPESRISGVRSRRHFVDNASSMCLHNNRSPLLANGDKIVFS